MSKNILKRVFCVMMSATVLSQSGISFQSEAVTKERALEVAKKVAPYAAGGVVLLTLAITLPIALKHKKDPAASKSPGNPSDPRNEGPQVNVTPGPCNPVRQWDAKVIQDCINRGELPGIKFEAKYGGIFSGGIVSFKYQITDVKLAREFLMYCFGQNTQQNEAIGLILERQGRFNSESFIFNDDPQNNAFAGFSSLWGFMKRAIQNSKRENKPEPAPAAPANPEIPHDSRAAGVEQPKSPTDLGKDLNQEIIDKINSVESIGTGGSDYESLYGQLSTRAGNVSAAGSASADKSTREQVKNAVENGVIPGLALLRFNSGSSVWHGYRIINDDVFKGYLLVMGVDTKEVDDILAQFKTQEELLFLHQSGGGGAAAAAANVLKAAKAAFVNLADRVQGRQPAQLNPETIYKAAWGIFYKDFTAIRELSGEKKFYGTIDFSEFNKNIVNVRDEIKPYEKFLKNSGCL